ncbi:MAG: hydrolase [Candidatus Dormibacteraeota bacterium]|nr:hydrolase [Candidatus Dormibacteraeota bacterium]
MPMWLAEIVNRRCRRSMMAGLFVATAAAVSVPISVGAEGLSLPSGGVHGVDVSSLQHPSGVAINWGRVAAAGFRFAFVKATQGDTYVNPYFGLDYAAAESAGLYRGAYDFANPSASGGANQADFLLSVAPYAIDGHTLPPVLDVEGVSGEPTCYGYSQAGMVSWIATFIDEVQARTGHLPIIYTNASWWNQCTGGSSAFANDPLWLASYKTFTPTLPAGWGTLAFWQYTNTGRVPGISTSTDLSYSPGGASGLGALAAA